LPAAVAGNYLDLALTDAKLVSEEFHQVGIGLAVDRWRSNPNLEGIAVGANELVFFGLGLQVEP
jgi:hypothetical protein